MAQRCGNNKRNCRGKLQIKAQSNISKTVVLNANNSLNTEVIYDVDIDGMTSLTLGGSAPILLIAPGDNLDKTVVTSTNSSGAIIDIKAQIQM